MKNTKLVLSILFLILFGLALYLPFLGGKEFQGEEGRRVLLALEMLEKKEFLIPSLFGEPYFTKPPLFNWLLATYFFLVGDYSEFTARSLSSLSLILASLFLTFLWAQILRGFFKENIDYLTLLLPGLIFLTIPEVIDKALRAEIDGFYTLIITLACYSWFYYHEIKGKKLWAFLLSGLFLGLGILTKTFQALVFFYLALVPYMLWQRRIKELLSLNHLVGIVAFTLVFALWALPVSMNLGLFPFLKAWLQEYLSAAEAREMTFIQHLEAYTFFALLGFAPWIFSLFVLKFKSFRDYLMENSELGKLFFYSIFLFGFSYLFHFLFPGARLRYVLPSVGGLAFLSSCVFFFYFHRARINFSVPKFFIGLILVVFILKQLYVILYYSYHQKNLNHFRRGALELSEKLSGNDTLYLCKTIPHHMIYYLKYRYQKVKEIYYLRSCENLPQGSFVLLKKKDLVPEMEKYEIQPLTIRTKEYYIIKVP